MKRVIIRFICVPPFFVHIRRSNGGRAPLFEEFLRLRSFNALISFLARSREDVLSWFDILFSLSGSRSSAGDVCKFHPEPRASGMCTMSICAYQNNQMADKEVGSTAHGSGKKWKHTNKSNNGT